LTDLANNVQKNKPGVVCSPPFSLFPYKSDVTVQLKYQLTEQYNGEGGNVFVVQEICELQREKCCVNEGRN
jgi:hypothetical protein